MAPEARREGLPPENASLETERANLEKPFDVVVVGGGITGAGVLLEAARRGLRALLVEAQDFANGSSSRSTKLVHGGLRYLRQGNLALTRASVHERDELLRTAPGLVYPLEFWLTSFEGDRTAPWVFGFGLTIYDALAGPGAYGRPHVRYSRHDADTVHARIPALLGARVRVGYRYDDAQTDDARLVLRVLEAARASGATALNYMRVRDLLRTNRGRVAGVRVESMAAGGGPTFEVQARLVINATGAWADELRGAVGKLPRLRPIRGSHLVFPHAGLPLAQAVSLLHPRDGRAVFALPWEGVTVVGTTDEDHHGSLWVEPRIAESEIEYLMALVAHAFPSRDLRREDIQATWAGVRAVIGKPGGVPSKASREHGIFREEGLVTVAGGKLTTFRRMAHEALRGVEGPRGAGRGGDLFGTPAGASSELEALGTRAGASPYALARLVGRYGAHAADVANLPEGFEAMARADGSQVALWGELRWAARHEAVQHLSDLLLRRVRLGLVVPLGELVRHLPRIRSLVQPELGWDDARWSREERAFMSEWRAIHGPTPTASSEHHDRSR